MIHVKLIHKKDSCTFSVKSLRSIIDNVINSPFAGFCFWNKWLPTRVNCFLWRLLLNRLPNRTKLRLRGINIPSDICPLCEANAEVADHLFLSCPKVQDIWNWSFRWCGLNLVERLSFDHLMFTVTDQGNSEKSKKFFEAALGGVMWFIWKARNDVVFNGKRYSATMVMDEVQTSLFTWIRYRSK